MPEAPQSPEIQKMFKMVKKVGELYLGDQLSNLLRTQTPERRDQSWQETAQEFGSFSERITGLRQALKSAYTTKEAYPEPITNVMGLHFADVEDQVARGLLSDLLFARTITSPGYIDYSMEVVEEAQAMATELGRNEGLRGEAMKSVGLNKVIGSVLSGDLKLTRQTQLEKK